MFRVIFYLLLTVVVITVLKSIVGIVLKGVSEAMKPGSGHAWCAPSFEPTSLKPGSVDWRTEERSGLWNLYRRRQLDQREGGRPDHPFLLPGMPR